MKPVHNTHKGLSVQNKVVLLLYLQYLNDSNFSHVVFEDENWEDATFHFNDCKRIFLEVKDLTSAAVSLAYVKREIFPDFVKKYREIKKDDKILVAAPKFDKEVESYANSLEYLSNWTKPKLIDKGFSEVEIKLLGKTHTFQYNQWLDLNLIAYLSPVLGFWLPESELENFKDHILQSVVTAKSAKGESLTRAELRAIIEKERATLQVEIFNPAEHSTTERVSEILATLSDDRERRRTIENPRILSSLMSNPSDVMLVMMALEKEVTNTNTFELHKWSPLFEACIHPAYTFRLIHLFENILKIDHSNDEFYLQFWATNITKMIPSYQDGHIVGEILRITSELIQHDNQLSELGFELLKQATQILVRAKFEERVSFAHDGHDRAQLGELARTIFNNVESFRQRDILEWAHECFALNREHGEYLSATPSSIYLLWKDFVMQKSDSSHLISFVRAVEDDYLTDPMLIASKGKKKGESIYEGYDHIGSGISQSGNVYSITDLAFVELVLKPYIEQWYARDPVTLWDFLPGWITTKQSEVGRYGTGKKPDYLSRALIPTIVNFYMSDDTVKSAQSYKWLASFMRFRRGIPSRTELIFQAVSSNKASAEKVWKLVRFQMNIKEYNKAPANIFVEQLLKWLLNQGLEEPLEYVNNLTNNETYLRYRGAHDFYLTELISSLIAVPARRDHGISLLKELLSSDYFNKQISNFDVYDIKAPIEALFTHDTDKGIELLQEIARDEKHLTQNRQIALTVYLRDIPEDKELLETLYKDVFREFCVPSVDQKRLIHETLTYVHSREELAEFAGRLCKVGNFDSAIEILKVLVNDPSPKADEYEDDMLKPNDLHAIQSVKAHVAWALQNFTNIYGRPYLEVGFNMISTLAADENIYIRSQACFPLTTYVQSRHYHMPEGKTIRYMESSLVRRVDELALGLLSNHENHKYPSLTKAIIHVISYMRALSTKDAKSVVKAVLNTNDTGIDDYIPTLFFFAEFRQDALTEWQWTKEFPLGEFDPTYFRNCIKHIAETGSSQAKTSIAWNLWTGITKEEISKEKAVQIAERYVDSLLAEYGNEWFADLYHLADDLVKHNEISKGLSIWKKCIAKEIEAITKPDFVESGYRGHHYDGEMLMIVRKEEGNDAYQHWLETILNEKLDTYLSNVRELYVLASKTNKARMLDLYPHVLVDEFNKKK